MVAGQSLQDSATRWLMNSDVDHTAERILVVGFGNELRGDDAAGPTVADLVARWNDPSVTVVRCHQLTPELAEAVARASRVIFVDAVPATLSAEVRVATLLAAAGVIAGLAHVCTPPIILALAQGLYGRLPPAWLVTVPAVRFEMGAPLSPECRAGVGVALDQIRMMMRRQTGASASGPLRPKH